MVKAPLREPQGDTLKCYTFTLNSSKLDQHFPDKNMLPKFLFGPVKKASNDMHPPGVSRTRKILIWILIIGFWVAFYWVQDPASP